VADQNANVLVHASDVTAGPECLLRAVTQLVQGADQARAEFEAVHAAYRWIFRRDVTMIRIRLLRLAGRGNPDDAGVLIWTSGQRIDVLAEAITRGFGQVIQKLGEKGYRSRWMRPFPHADLEASAQHCAA
jgi:hypothetical protein